VFFFVRGCKRRFNILKEEQQIGVSENGVLRGILGTERGECQEVGGNGIMSSFVMCVLQTAGTVSGQM
jgi:hypothetical protein